MNDDLMRLYQRVQASSALTVALPSEYGVGSISRLHTPRGMYISNWSMQYHRDTCVEGASGREVRLTFCLGDGVEWETGREMMVRPSTPMLSSADCVKAPVCWHSRI